MYEYPPSDWQFRNTENIFLNIVAFGIYLGVIVGIDKKKHVLKQLSPTLISIAALLATLKFTLFNLPLPDGKMDEQVFHSVFVLLTWTVATIAVLKNLSYLHSQPESLLGVLSMRELIFIGMPFVCFLFLLLTLFLSGNRQPISHIRKMRCVNNMRNISVAIQTYATGHWGHIPATTAGEPPRSWRVEVLPYLDQSELRNRYQDSQRWNSGENKTVAKTVLTIYRCPDNPQTESDDGYPLTAYAAITGTNATWNKTKPANLDALSRADGLSQTLMLVEACGQNIAWAEPRDVALENHQMGINLPGSKPGWSDGIMSSTHIGVVNVVFADGSVRSLSEKADPIVLKKLCTATGGEPLLPSEF